MRPNRAMPSEIARSAVFRSAIVALEYAKRGIRVNAVAPGTIKTPMHSPEVYAQLDALHPVGHMGEISDIVDAILYLQGAGFVTGEILHVDGGQSAGH
jgi:NAD(P)-dependent dehydrogenase (short-subunit alcohol dehydrogenase family)